MPFQAAEPLVPPLTIALALEPGQSPERTLRQLPARPGVFALEDEQQRTLCLAVTADLRRLVRARLAPAEPGAPPSRRVDYASLARRVRAVTVGSSFEADWVYLQLARRRLPATFASLLDRWRGWFIHVNPAARFPRFVKTATPRARPTPNKHTYIGPYADKHAAQRIIEALQDGFDLCRYHHILVQAPDATACAYKEMGRCPAPCDGTVTMKSYRAALRAAIEHACDAGGGAEALRQRMEKAAAALSFEEAAALRRRLAALAELERPQHRYAGRLSAFRYLAVLPSERPGAARLFLVVGGHIAPVLDLPFDAGERDIGAVTASMNALCAATTVELSEQAVQNIGLVCWHLFRARRSDRATFIRIGAAPLAAGELTVALARLRGGAQEVIADAEIEG